MCFCLSGGSRGSEDITHCVAALQAQSQLRKSVLVVGKHAVCEWMAEVSVPLSMCHPLAKPAGSEQAQSLLCVTVTAQLNASTMLMEDSRISIPFVSPVEFIPDQVGFLLLKVRLGLT